MNHFLKDALEIAKELEISKGVKTAKTRVEVLELRLKTIVDNILPKGKYDANGDGVIDNIKEAMRLNKALEIRENQEIRKKMYNCLYSVKVSLVYPKHTA